MSRVRKVAVTGTKGKTTVVNILAYVFGHICKGDVLLVNTTGHFLNGERRSSFEDSTKNWGLVPSVAPGRYLYEFIGKDTEDSVAVLEASLGSSTLSGLGYALHQVGIFLNIFEDHIGNSERIKSREDIFKAKSFIFERILSDGKAILNYDDELVMKALPLLPVDRGVTPFFFGLNLFGLNIDNDFVTIKNDVVIYFDNKNKKEIEIVRVNDIVWTFNGQYIPSVYNLLAVVSGVISLLGYVPENLGDILRSSRLDPYGGRLTLLKGERGQLIIADYAHEKKSLVDVGKLAHKMKGKNGKVTGVVRLAYDRTNELIEDTGKTIAEHYDQFVVYDKIDGHFRHPKEVQFKRFTQEVGKISKIFSEAIKTKNPNVEQILREDLALEKAAEISKAGDVVVVIVNDDITRSINWIKEKFNADFV